jgi:predicted patatin/cPLA2 family phospholipase
MSTVPPAPAPAVCRILSLDGGGAKGFYTLGVLNEIEAMIAPRRLCEHFNLIFGTSTGAIIAALLALGYTVAEVHRLYRTHVPTVMKRWFARTKSKELSKLATTVFDQKRFNDVLTGVGIVATRWREERPMIFKGDREQAHGRKDTFVSGFGCTIADAVRASCSAYPYFEKCMITTSAGNEVELIDGGYCANNPTLYAIADAVRALNKPLTDLRVVSVGVGVYPEPKRWYTLQYWYSLVGKCFVGFTGVELLQKTLNVNTESMEQLRSILYGNVQAVRINDTYHEPEMATDLMESDLKKLNTLYQRGGDSFAQYELKLRELLDLPAKGGGHA